MKPSDFSPDAPGRLNKTPEGYWAFIPHPLPPTLVLSPGLIEQLSVADRSVGELSGVARTLPNPHLLIGPFVRREAVLSSRIEGTQASLSDLFYFEASGKATPEAPDVKEVANYVKSLEYALRRLAKLPVSLRLIREMHRQLLEGVRGEHFTPGEFRRSQNWIGPPGCTLTEAVFVPPPAGEMMQCLDVFEKYLHQASPFPQLVQLAVVHYQFEAIHPFLDGNGRIGRLLVTLLMSTRGLLPRPLLYLSAYFERHRDEYYRHLLSVSQKGTWIDWITFFLRGVADQSQDALARAASLLDLWRDYRAKVQSARSSALLLQLVDQFFADPAITVGRAARLLKVTYRSAQLNIDKLVEQGILQEVTGRERNRVFAAREIIRIVEAQSSP